MTSNPDPRTCDECGAILADNEEDICSDCEEAENDYSDEDDEE